jgi:hypothetical protein
MRHTLADGLRALDESDQLGQRDPQGQESPAMTGTGPKTHSEDPQAADQRQNSRRQDADESTAGPDGRPAQRPPAEDEEHEGGTEEQVGDRTGPGAGYDDEPEQVPDKGGVA